MLHACCLRMALALVGWPSKGRWSPLTVIVALSKLSLAGAATNIIFVATKRLSWQRFCLDKHTFVATNTFLSRQNTSFVPTNVCLSRQNFCLLDKHTFVANKDVFCRDKHMVVETKPLSWQTFCRDKNDTCDSSRQWYQTALHQEGEVWPKISAFCVHCISCKTNKAATFNIVIDSMKFPLQSRVSFVVDSVKQLFRTKWWFPILCPEMLPHFAAIVVVLLLQLLFGKPFSLMSSWTSVVQIFWPYYLWEIHLMSASVLMGWFAIASVTAYTIQNSTF